MSHRTVLMYMAEGADVDALTAHAAALARLSEGRLVGLSCHHPGLPWSGGATPAFAEGDPLTLSMREAEEAEVERERIFLHRCRQAGLRDFDAVRDDAPAAAAICAQALAADIVVMGAPERDGPHHAARRAAVETVLLDCARPVLLLPNGGHAGHFEPENGVAVVAWDGSVGAAHAASAALPLLRHARRVDLVRVVPPEIDACAGFPADLQRAADWLSRHGVADVRLRLAPPRDGSVGRALLFDAEAAGARLLVMGAWGRPRVVERLLGGATRDVLAGLSVATLFSH